MKTWRACDYERIEKAILFLEENRSRRPGLKEVAEAVNLSGFHFQQLFKRWAGISPKRFLQALIIEHAKEVLKNPGGLIDVACEAGLSGPGRPHDLFVKIEAITPNEFRNHGAGLSIRYGFHKTPFGECFIAITERGVSNLAFVTTADRAKVVCGLKKQWRRARFIEDRRATRRYAEMIFGDMNRDAHITLHLKGTNFQIKVWQALLKIAPGKVSSYEDMARMVGRPSAVRPVANAVARNPVAYLIPCHRIIRKTGAIGGYRWGRVRKKMMLALEAAAQDSCSFEK